MKGNAMTMAKLVSLMATLATAITATVSHGESWAAEEMQSVLTTPSLEMTLQGGLPVRVVNTLSKTDLLTVPLDSPLSVELLVGQPVQLDQVDVQLIGDAEDDSVVRYRWALPGGDRVTFKWYIKEEDIVCEMAAETTRPIETIQLQLPRCDLRKHKMVWVTNFGISKAIEAPYAAKPDKGLSGYFHSIHYIQPLISLFEGEASGFVIDGRFKELAGGGINFVGHGQSMDVAYYRTYLEPTTTLRLYPVHFRGYEGNWRRGVDPYVKWMEEGLGFVPLAKKRPQWIRGIRGQAYCQPWPVVPWSTKAPGGPFSGLDWLERIAKHVEPSQFLVGKISEYRPRPESGFDHNYPYYRPDAYAEKFFRRADAMGYRTAFHVNAFGIDLDNTNLIERFRPGLRQTGTDQEGKPVYWGHNFPNNYGQVNFAWCSLAYKPFREFLIEQIKPMIDAGADVVYLDESHTPLGRFEVDGVTAIEGVQLLEKEIIEAYPDVAIMTEQFNLLNARHAGFALVTGEEPDHPLGMYIFGHYVKFTDWADYIRSRNSKGVERFMRTGYMLPGGRYEPDRLAIAGAFQKYQLDPAPMLEVDGETRLFGFRGKDVIPSYVTAYSEKRPDVTAYYEKRGTAYGLAVYSSDNAEKEWIPLEMDTPSPKAVTE
jgi:hypothetical protein